MKKYVFAREIEGNVERIDSADLEEFRTFCHYSSLSDWKEHKNWIKKCLKETGSYIFDGNDVKYSVHVLDY